MIGGCAGGDFGRTRENFRNDDMHRWIGVEATGSVGLPASQYQLTDKESVSTNSVDFGKVSFVKLAEANGWDAHFVTSRPMLEQRMAEAFERNRPTLLELPVRYQYKFNPPA